MTDLLERVATAYHSDAFLTHTKVEASLDVGGLLFRWKCGRDKHLTGLHVVADIAEPRIQFTRWYDGHAELSGHRVSFANGAGHSERPDARSHFPYGRQFVHWDALDTAYFLGYALWNYFTFPALLRRADVEWTESAPDVLTARFDPSIPTHCEVQKFRVDPVTCLVREHDYNAQVFGNWAKACHLTSEYEVGEGFPYATKRRVQPRKIRGGPLARPNLIWANVRDYGVS